MGGADLAGLAKMLMEGGQGQGPPQPQMAPMGGGGKPPLMMPPQAPAPPAASAQQGPQSIGALLASPAGQKVLAVLRQLQQGQQMAA